MEFGPSLKTYLNYKSASPDETIERINEGFKRLGLKVEYEVIQTSDNPGPLFYGRAIIGNTYYMSTGKGTSPELAKASAFAELAERLSNGSFLSHLKHVFRHSPTFRKLVPKGDIIRKFMSRAYLRGYEEKRMEEIVNKVDFAQFIHSKYQQKIYRDIVEKDMQYPWVDAFSLISKEYLKISLPIVSKLIGGSTNGMAAGNTLAEAVVQGSCEVFERYCFYTVITNHQNVPTLSIQSIKNKKIIDLISFYHSLNIDVIIKDFTLGNRFPVIGVLFINNNISSTSENTLKQHFFRRITVGAALNLEEALVRCFTEEMQAYHVEEYMHQHSLDILWNYWTGILGKNWFAPTNLCEMYTRRHIYGDLSFLEAGTHMIEFSSLPSCHSTDFRADLEEIISICRKEQLDLLVLDMTNPVLSFPSVKIIIPPLMYLGNADESCDFFYHDYYMKNPQWIEKEGMIREYIDTAEKYLSSHITHYHFKNIFGRSIPVFSTLAYLHLFLDEHATALHYFMLLRDLHQTSVYDELINQLSSPEDKSSIAVQQLKNPYTDANFEENSWDTIMRELTIPTSLYKVIKSLSLIT